MTCIIHYEGLSNYDELSQVTAKTAEKILLAKSLHESSNDTTHEKQCKSIPNDELANHHYHKNPCYKRFCRVTVKSKSLSISTSSQTRPTTSTNVKTRSKRTSSTKFEEFIPPSKKKQAGPTPKRQTRRRSSSTLATSTSRNEFVFGIECVLCGQYELRYKNKEREDVREYPLALTLDDPAKKVKERIAANEKYRQLSQKLILVDDLISAEFKYHKRCYKELMTEDKVGSVVGRPNQGFKKVIEHIDNHVMKMNQVVSMNTIHDICFGKPDINTNTGSILKRKQRLKLMLKDHFGESIAIIGTASNHPDVLINSENLDSEVTLNSNQESIIKNAAKFLRKDILEFCSKLTPLSWPPTIEELLSENRLPPPATILFLTTLLKSPKHAATDRIRRIVDSYAADFVYGVSGELTAKHYLLGHGLHCMTGNKESVLVTNRLGHSASYDTILDIETAQAQKAVELMNSANTSILTLRPKYPEQTVLIFFWADNFNKNVDKESGGGAIEITTMMAFQEHTIGAIYSDRKINVPKTRSRKVSVDFDMNDDITFNDKQEPDVTNFQRVEDDLSDCVEEFSCKYFTWLFLRYRNRTDQVHPNLAGMLLRLRQKEATSQSTKISKTEEIFLPPLPTKVTDPKTIFTYFKYFQKLAEEMNMPYVNVTLDVGAALNAYKLLWRYPVQFSNVFIHLGDFHVMKENFKIMGLFLQSSGFEDIVYQARLCTSGSLNGVMTGGHYNRAWRVHEVVHEALERSLLKRFINDTDPSISDELIDLASEESDLVTLQSLRYGEKFSLEFKEYQQSVRNGSLGKTAQWCLIYMDMMRNQHMYHTSVQENDFDLRTASIEFWVPFYMYYNMQNYARYGLFYLQVLKNIEKLYPGLKDLLVSKGLSVQSQDRYPLRTAIDMRGEQTINRDAKTSGGVAQFASSISSVQKWTMNRSDAAETKKALHNMAGLSDPNTIYKSLRPRQIVNSEVKVRNVTNVVENDYINPFGLDIDQDCLVNITSGVSLPNEIAEEILNQETKGKKLVETFNENRLFSTKSKIHESIKKNDCKSFKSSKVKYVVKKNGVQGTVEVNRNILGALNSFSLKTNVAVDYKKALKYPLSPCPLSISHADGRKRSTRKSDLKEILLNSADELPLDRIKGIGNAAVIVDMMGVINILTQIPDTYEELAERFVGMLPRGYERIDVVADKYTSVKLHKHGVPGDQFDKILIPSLHSRVHPEFKTMVLKNRENKVRLIQLIFEHIKTNALSCLEALGSSTMVLSSEDECVSLRRSDNDVMTIVPFPELLSNHDEGDTKVILHAYRILIEDADAVVTIRSPSGDTDILVLMIGILYSFRDRVILDDYHGTKGRKSYRLGDIELDDEIIESLIGFHAFTGNDFVSSFFKKGKLSCFKVMENDSHFRSAFTQLGSSWDLSDDTYDVLQSFVIKLYGTKKKTVDEARYAIFKKKYDNEEKTVDMSVLPPCESVLRLHCERANYLAAIWRRANISQPLFPDAVHYGWNTDKSILWVNEIFPEEIETILLDARYDPGDVTDAHCDSEDEEMINE